MASDDSQPEPLQAIPPSLLLSDAPAISEEPSFSSAPDSVPVTVSDITTPMASTTPGHDAPIDQTYVSRSAPDAPAADPPVDSASQPNTDEEIENYTAEADNVPPADNDTHIEGDPPVQVPFSAPSPPTVQTTRTRPTSDPDSDAPLINARTRKRKAVSTTFEPPPETSSKKKKKAKKVAQPPPPPPPRIRLNRAFSTDYYFKESSKFALKDLVHRDFQPEESFADKAFRDFGFLKYLEEKRLLFWATGLKKYCPALVREFYANLHPEVLQPDSIWFGKIYIRGELLEFTPAILNNLLELPPNADYDDHMDHITETLSEIASHISNGRSNTFGRNSMSPSLFLLKFHCLYKFCSLDVRPTSNTSQISSEMGKIMFCIDKYLELTNFGAFILKRMLSFTRENISKSSMLPYPCLITLFLEKNGVLPLASDHIVKIKAHSPGPHIRVLNNDLKFGPPPSGEILSQEIKNVLIAHNQRLTELSNQIITEKRKISTLIAKIPRSMPSSNPPQTTVASDGSSSD